MAPYFEEHNLNKKRMKYWFNRAMAYLSRYGPPITMLLILTNIIMFAILSVTGGSTDGDNLVRFGASVNVLVYDNQIWRLFTCMFLHSGILHLALNMFALYSFGNLVENRLGTTRFTILYFAAGILASIASVIFRPEASTVPSVGASGAIFGLVGAIIYLGIRSPYFFKRVLGANFIFVLVANLFLGFIMPGIDNLAHIGGLVGGFIVSWALGLEGDVPDTTVKISRIFVFALMLICLLKISFTSLT